MKIKNKRHLFLILLIALSVFFFYRLFTIIVGIGFFDKTYNREELVDNFNKHEIYFQKIYEYFQSVISSTPHADMYQISFGLGKDNNHIAIALYPKMFDTSSKIIGSNNLRKGSIEFYSILATLGWSEDVVNIMEKQLSMIGCNVIRTVDYYGGCKFQIYPDQCGVNSYSYHIFENPLSDSLLCVHGKTISQSDFGKRVVLVNTTIL